MLSVQSIFASLSECTCAACAHCQPFQLKLEIESVFCGQFHSSHKSDQMCRFPAAAFHLIVDVGLHQQA